MTPEQMLDKMLEYVNKTNHVSFAELERCIGEEAKGDLAICLNTSPNVILWQGVSNAFADAIELLRTKTEVKGTSILVYLIDGKVPGLPIARRIPKKGFVKPHWAPIVFVRRSAQATQA